MSECFEKTAVLEGGLELVARLLHENWVEKFKKDFKLLFLHQLSFIFSLAQISDKNLIKQNL